MDENKKSSPIEELDKNIKSVYKLLDAVYKAQLLFAIEMGVVIGILINKCL